MYRFIWLALTMVFLQACYGRNKKQGKLEPVALVHGSSITQDYFARELAFALRTSTGLLPQNDQEELAYRKAVLSDLVDRMLIIAAARDAGITISSDKIDKELLRLKAEYHGASFNQELYEGKLSPQELRERIRVQLTIASFFSDKILTRVAVTDSEIEAYFKQHPEQFFQPEQVRAAQIVVQTSEEAEHILAEIRRGLAFDEAARRYSLSPDSKVGGDLGFFKRGIMPAIFDQTCFNLGKGQISEIVTSDYGFHIFKVLDKRPAVQRSLEKSRRDVEKFLLQQKREKAQKRALLELRAGTDATGCKKLGQDGGISATKIEEEIVQCLNKAGQAHIKINESILSQMRL